MANYGSKKRFIHLFVDHATRYAWAFPHTNETADAYIECIGKLCLVKTPKRILTDRHPSFLSGKIKHFLQHKGIKHLLTTPQHPEGNGIVERLNQTLITRLKCKINTKQRPWPRLLEECMQEYNDTSHEVMQFSPNFLLYGIKPYNLVLQGPNIDLAEARHQAWNNTMQYHMSNKRYFDKKRQDGHFQVGEEVLLEVLWQPNNGKLVKDGGVRSMGFV